MPGMAVCRVLPPGMGTLCRGYVSSRHRAAAQVCRRVACSTCTKLLSAFLGCPLNQHAVQELAAKDSDEAFAGRVHPRCLDVGAQDRGAGGLEDGVERGGQVRPAFADQELDVLELLAGGVGAGSRACCMVHSPDGCAVTLPRCIRRVPCSMNTSTYRLWVPTMPSPHATCEYSWIRPPSRSRLRTRMVSSAGATGILPSGGRWLSVRCGRWVL